MNKEEQLIATKNAIFYINNKLSKTMEYSEMKKRKSKLLIAQSEKENIEREINDETIQLTKRIEDENRVKTLNEQRENEIKERIKSYL